MNVMLQEQREGDNYYQDIGTLQALKVKVMMAYCVLFVQLENHHLQDALLPSFFGYNVTMVMIGSIVSVLWAATHHLGNTCAPNVLDSTLL